MEKTISEGLSKQHLDCHSPVGIPRGRRHAKLLADGGVMWVVSSSDKPAECVERTVLSLFVADRDPELERLLKAELFGVCAYRATEVLIP